MYNQFQELCKTNKQWTYNSIEQLYTPAKEAINTCNGELNALNIYKVALIMLEIEDVNI